MHTIPYRMYVCMRRPRIGSSSQHQLDWPCHPVFLRSFHHPCSLQQYGWDTTPVFTQEGLPSNDPNAVDTRSTQQRLQDRNILRQQHEILPPRSATTTTPTCTTSITRLRLPQSPSGNVVVGLCGDTIILTNLLPQGFGCRTLRQSSGYRTSVKIPFLLSPIPSTE